MLQSKLNTSNDLQAVNQVKVNLLYTWIPLIWEIFGKPQFEPQGLADPI